MTTVTLLHHRLDELVRRTAGLNVHSKELPALERWTAERIRVLGLDGVETYGELLADRGATGRRERELLTIQFSTGETYFFRDQPQFELLANRILPELIERRSAKRELRIWSAGCATGEEAYSLAMLVDDLAPRLAGWRVLILGTDISAQALDKARRGVYSQWSFRTLDAARKQRYFRLRGHQWKLEPRLRSMVSFRCGDLVGDRFPDASADLQDFDLILCRNVFIYLVPHAIAGITAKFAEALAEGGYLVTGHSELFGHNTGPLRTRVFAESVVFERIAGPVAAAVEIEAAPTQTKLPVVPSVRGTSRIDHRKVRVAHEAVSVPPARVPPARDLDALMRTAWRQADRGALEAAAETCRAATAAAGFDPRPYYLLAQLAQEGGDFGQAKALLKKVIYLDSSCVAAHLELGALYENEGDVERSRRMRRAAAKQLKMLPSQTAVAPYGESTAGEILQYVERRLGEPSEHVANVAVATARSRSIG